STTYPYAGSEEFASMKRPRTGFVPLLPPAEAALRLAAHREAVRRQKLFIERTKKEDPLAKRVAELNGEAEAAKQEAAQRAARQEDADALRAEAAALAKQRDETSRQLQQKVNALAAELHRLERSNLPPDLPGAYAVSDGKADDARVHLRG